MDNHYEAIIDGCMEPGKEIHQEALIDTVTWFPSVNDFLHAYSEPNPIKKLSNPKDVNTHINPNAMLISHL
jgi:hypothetical protein